MREDIIQLLIREVVGPDPRPEYTDEVTGEELLLERVHGSPKSRYGSGMLYPQAIRQNGIITDEEESHDFEVEEGEVSVRTDEHGIGSWTTGQRENGSSEETIGLANEFLPSAMGFTSRYSLKEDASIVISIETAWYERMPDTKAEKIRKSDTGNIEDKLNPSTNEIVERNYWVRRPVVPEAVEIRLSELQGTRGKVLERQVLNIPGSEADWLKLEIFNRSTHEDQQENCLTITISIVNCSTEDTDHHISDQRILFQNRLRVEAEPETVIPFLEKASGADTEEEEEMRLLYRDQKVFAIGHGCSVVWESDTDTPSHISTSFIPEFEVPPVKPTSNVEISMLNLSDRGDWASGLESLHLMADEYEQWINNLESGIPDLPQSYHAAASRNIHKCRENLHRIRDGVELLASKELESAEVRSFRWMNRAMIWQQQRSKTPQRRWSRNGNRFTLGSLAGEADEHESLEVFHSNERNGRWRPFQIAFILMNLSSVFEPESTERGVIDLIWFPTGGGKTEAYLGLSALLIFSRRLRGDFVNHEKYSGTAILMRYTLRLLTAQQFERASSLICACDLIRRENPDLGFDRISIGLWVGGASTPNRCEDALFAFRKLTGREHRSAEYNFVVMKCPCCGAHIGKLDDPSRNRKIIGLRQEGQRTLFSCENPQCEYYNHELPLYVVDDDIYRFAPTLVLGTVDKFAMVPWKIETGAIFGFRGNGTEVSRIQPPELIIQDELHLISGPLGTMVGLYEILIQTLCNSYNIPEGERRFESQDFFVPKIIASSATISRASEQVKALYGTDRLNIFPPQGLAFGDTWFSEQKRPDERNPGRKYIGILAPGYQSGQTTVVRSYSAVLQGIKEVDRPDCEKDFYWTLVGYFNSIRELGMASSLIYADIRDYLKTIIRRNLVPFQMRRYRIWAKELTSRIPAHEIPDSLKSLEVSYDSENNRSLDICLATNMIATGVDISRLGIMFIHGQPKTTSEYIQASSRIGRDARGPGLVVMIYSPAKPRDKSQYEHFYSFHSRIYSHVEPTSVTPYSVNSRDRGLHGVVIGLIRHFSTGILRFSPDHTQDEAAFNRLYSWVSEQIQQRCEFMDPVELHNTTQRLNEIREKWCRGFQEYGDAANTGILHRDQIPLMYSKGFDVTEFIRESGVSFPTPTTMRGVDEESRISIIIP